MSNPYALQIARLETELEAATQRCKALQAFLSNNGDPKDWGVIVPPLTLYQTRLLRLVATRPLPGWEAVNILLAWYPGTTNNSLEAQLCMMRKVLPVAIAPAVRTTSRYSPIDVPDRAALAEFLAGGVLPEQRRAA
jgi:hypothetical protein